MVIAKIRTPSTVSDHFYCTIKKNRGRVDLVFTPHCAKTSFAKFENYVSYRSDRKEITWNFFVVSCSLLLWQLTNISIKLSDLRHSRILNCGIDRYFQCVLKWRETPSQCARTSEATPNLPTHRNMFSRCACVLLFFCFLTQILVLHF